MIEVPNNDPNAAISILASISRFGVLTETRGMLDWLRAELARLDRLNRHEINIDVFRQRQGACQLLEKIIEDYIETADNKIEQIRSNIRRKGDRS